MRIVILSHQSKIFFVPYKILAHSCFYQTQVRMSDEQKEVIVEEKKEEVKVEEAKPRQQRAKKEPKPKKEKQPPPQKKEKASVRSELLGVGADKNKEFGKWYSNIVKRAELVENYDVSGCFILVCSNKNLQSLIFKYSYARIETRRIRNLGSHSSHSRWFY